MNNDTGVVIDLFISTLTKERKNPLEISLDENGIIDDKFYNKDVTRSILISSVDSYSLAIKNNIKMNYGELGENIVIDINPYGLSSGDKLLIGEVELEITMNCTICNSLAKVDKNLPKLLKNDRGIFAKTSKSGKIRKGDMVKLIKY